MSTRKQSPLKRASGTAQGVDDYLASVPEDARAALERLRTIIKAAAPGGSEVISYRIPIYKHNGKLLVGFAAFTEHCSLFVMSPQVMRAHAADLKGYDTAKGTVHFPADKPLPAALIRKLVKARLAENAGSRRPLKGRKARIR